MLGGVAPPLYFVGLGFGSGFDSSVWYPVIGLWGSSVPSAEVPRVRSAAVLMIAVASALLRRALTKRRKSKFNGTKLFVTHQSRTYRIQGNQFRLNKSQNASSVPWAAAVST